MSGKLKTQIEPVLLQLLIMEWIYQIDTQTQQDQGSKTQQIKNVGKSMGHKYMIYYSKDTLDQYLSKQMKESAKQSNQPIKNESVKPTIFKIKYIFDEFFQFVFGVTGDQMARNPLGQYTALVGINKCCLLKRLDSTDIDAKVRLQNYVCCLMCGIVEGATQEIFGQSSTVNFKITQNEKIEFSLVL